MNRNSTTATLASLQIGMPRPLQHGSREVTSGIFKTATQEPLRIGRLGIQGDGQGDTIHHGGPDKAVCAYFDGRYPFWREEFGLPFPNGSFGENFTIAGWLEDDLCIGDIVTIASPRLGRLVNRMRRTHECEPWTFGTGALMRNLAARGLLS